MLVDIETNNYQIFKTLSNMKKDWERNGNCIIVDLTYPQLVSLHDTYYLDATFKIKN